MRRASDIIMIWPEHTLGYVITIGLLILLIASFMYFILHSLYKRDEKRNQDWVRIYNWAIKHKLSSEEMSILEFFFNELKTSIRQEIIKNKKQFRDALIKYLISANLPVKHKVHLIGKLFPEIEAQAEINTLEDIQSGEFCILQQENEEFFCRIYSREDHLFRLKCAEKDISNLDAEAESSLYIYRNKVGGYKLPGSVKSISDRVVDFLLSGNINFTGTAHIMAEIDCSLELTPHPELYLLEKLRRENEMKDIPSEKLKLRLHGETNKISDRAMIFRLIYRGQGKEDFLLDKLKYSVDVDDTLLLDETIYHKQPMWNLNLYLPGGMLFQSRGHVIPDKKHKGYLLFKFVSPDPKSIQVLIAEIKKAGAVPEKLN